MKLKSILPMIVALVGMSLLPSRSQASATYGAFVTRTYYGSVRVFDTNGQVTTQSFWLNGSAFNAQWTATLYSVNSLAVTVDAALNLHSVVKALTYFSGGLYKNEPSVTTIDVTVFTSGSQTMGVQIMDYFKPATLLYTSGKTSTGSILELPLTQGGFTVAQ